MTTQPTRREGHPDSAGANISLANVTKDYGHDRGVFGLTLEVAPGEAMGFLGANGAGKTVTMRTLMGFIKPGTGTARIAGLDCFSERAEVQRLVGYLPGEVTCPEDLTGRDFLRLVADLRGSRDSKRTNDLLERFELDPTAKIGTMSKGTKQKVALVAAFMDTPQVLLLDEPTSGLDPVMQDRFVELVAEERRRGATVLLSSHQFGEVERTCDRVAFIRSGHLVGVRSLAEIRAGQRHAFAVTFASPEEANRYRTSARAAHVAVADAAADKTALTVELTGTTDAFVKELAGFSVAGLTSREQTLEDLFRHIYEGGRPDTSNDTSTAEPSPTNQNQEASR